MQYKGWYYETDATLCKRGNMICNHCNKPITEGAYKAKDKLFHKSCCETDAGWERVRQDYRDSIVRLKRILCKEQDLAVAYKDCYGKENSEILDNLNDTKFRLSRLQNILERLT